MSFAEEEVAMQLTVCKEPSAGSGHSRCLASGSRFDGGDGGARSQEERGLATHRSQSRMRVTLWISPSGDCCVACDIQSW